MYSPLVYTITYIALATPVLFHPPEEAGKTMGEDPSREFLLSYSLVGSVYLHRAALSLGPNCINTPRYTETDAASQTQHWKANRYGKWISPGTHPHAPLRCLSLSLSLPLSFSLVSLSLSTARYFFHVVYIH